jgi:hypothetical protein
VKEVREETGIECEPLRLLALLDGLRLGFTRVPLSTAWSSCAGRPAAELDRPPAGDPRRRLVRPATPCPSRSAGANQWLAHANRAIDGEDVGVLYDEPRPRPWAD